MLTFLFFFRHPLVSCHHKLYPGFGVFLRKVCEEEAHLIPFEKYTTSLRLVLPVLDVIVTNLPAVEALKTFSRGKSPPPLISPHGD